MRLPEFVTFTGVDEATDLLRLKSLQDRYPVEWGVLFSPARQGDGRYPALGFVATLPNRGLRLAAHICGRHADSVLDGSECEPVEALPQRTFRRIQVNTARADAEPMEVAAFAAWVGAESGILQCRGDAFPADASVDWLHDTSGGRGTMPTAWPGEVTTKAFVGYAGGIGPDNALDTVRAINVTHPAGKPYWIDMETRIRTEDVLDLDKCEAVLVSIYGRR